MKPHALSCLVFVLALTSAAAHAKDRWPAPLPELMMARVFDEAGAFRADAGRTSLGAQVLSMLGREDLIARAPSPPCVRQLSRRQSLRRIAEAAREAPIVLINEDHARAQTRLVIREIGVRLRPLGYAHYAVETLAADYAAQADTDGSTLSMLAGTYTMEPVFAATVRALRDLGYTAHAYDEMGPDRDAREATQAARIAAIVHASVARGEKVLGHAGHGHIAERVFLQERPPWAPMALRLKTDHGIDPLTINLLGAESRTGEWGLCLSNEGGGLATDFRAALPRERFAHGRSIWRFKGARRYPIAPDSQARVIEARREEDPFLAAPVDRVLVLPGERITLALPRGRYRLDQWRSGVGWSDHSIVTIR